MNLLTASSLFAAAISAAAIPDAAAEAASDAGALAAAPLSPILQNGRYNTGDWEDNPSTLEPAPVPGPWRAINWINVNKPSFTGDSSPMEVYPYSVFFTPDRPAHMSSSYPGSKVSFFELSSLELGCAQIQAFGGSRGTYNAPVNCTISIDGYRGPVTGSPAASKTVAYKPNDDVDDYGNSRAKPANYSLGLDFIAMQNIVFTPKLGDNSGGGVPQYPVYAYWYNVDYQVFNVTL